MSRNAFTVAALACIASSSALAYDTGQFTCQNIGELAAQSVQAKQSGIPYQEYLTAINERMPEDAVIERRLVANITGLIYEDQQLQGIAPEDAYVVFSQDCMIGLHLDQQQEDPTKETGAPGDAPGTAPDSGTEVQ